LGVGSGEGGEGRDRGGGKGSGGEEVVKRIGVRVRMVIMLKAKAAEVWRAGGRVSASLCV